MELNQVFAIGDALKDLQAFANAGCQPILVRTGKGEETLKAGNLPANTLVFANLNEAVQHIISENT